ncbi:MAG TPA: zinc ribbon domain-containing protein [Solirubrobacteraceae bacterium]
MSTFATTPGGAGPPAGEQAPPAGAPLPGESCPLCGSPLHPEQEWCLRCGAAARTRLAASPNWKAPVAGILVVLALSLGVLAAALVKLAGDTGPGKPASTATVTTAAAAPSAPTTATPIPTTASTSARTPTSTTTTRKAKVKATAPKAGAGAPGTTTTRTTSGTPSTGLTGVGKALEERLRKQAAENKKAGK